MKEKNNHQFRQTANAFGKWRGAEGKLLSYEPNRQILRLALWFESLPDMGYLHLLFGGCTRINLPVRWSGCSLTITELPQARQFKIDDPTLGILIVCSGSGAIPQKERFWRDP